MLNFLSEDLICSILSAHGFAVCLEGPADVGETRISRGHLVVRRSRADFAGRTAFCLPVGDPSWWCSLALMMEAEECRQRQLSWSKQHLCIQQTSTLPCSRKGQTAAESQEKTKASRRRESRGAFTDNAVFIIYNNSNSKGCIYNLPGFNIPALKQHCCSSGNIKLSASCKSEGLSLQGEQSTVKQQMTVWSPWEVPKRDVTATGFHSGLI